jgi:hypothetical protein
MKSILFVVSSIAVLLLVACPLHTGLDSNTPGSPEEPPVVEPGPRVETDTARGLAVFVNEDGQRFDVVAVDDDGADVVCVEPVDISIMDPEPETELPSGVNASTAPTTPGLKAIISGRRADGSYALWAVLRDNTIHLVFCEGGDRRAPTMPECWDRDGWLRGWMGWRYHVTGTATDGTTTIVVGYAESVRGFRRWPWAVEPGTTVGVYWKVLKSPTCPYCCVTPARVIGVRNPTWHPPWQRHRHAPRGWLRGLKLFLDGYFASYLTMATGVTWDTSNTVFVVPGTNEEGNSAEATIDRQGCITITEVQVDKPDLTVDPLVLPTRLLRMGETWRLAANVKNIGKGPVAAITVRFTVSADSVLDTNDTLAGEVEITSLKVEESKEALLSETFSLSNPGTQWIFVTADPEDEIGEENEGNNTASASVAVYYERLIIDTYKPKGGGQGGTTDTFLSLFDKDGERKLPITEDDNSNISYYTAARIDYTDSNGIAPGTVFYARIRGGTASVSGPYAIRLITSSPDPYASSWFYTTDGNDAGYESDDKTTDGVPDKINLLPVGGKLNRSLTPNDVDWVKLVLP